MDFFESIEQYLGIELLYAQKIFLKELCDFYEKNDHKFPNKMLTTRKGVCVFYNDVTKNKKE